MPLILIITGVHITTLKMLNLQIFLKSKYCGELYIELGIVHILICVISVMEQSENRRYYPVASW